jgi:hypothetical protein
MEIIKIIDKAGSFAENKDTAKELRVNEIMPRLSGGEKIILDFEGVSGATQSFIHALISEPIRKHGDIVFETMVFKSCSPALVQVINIVADYMEDSASDEV